MPRKSSRFATATSERARSVRKSVSRFSLERQQSREEGGLVALAANDLVRAGSLLLERFVLKRPFFG
jgi:hypothetical protein